jgi:hypothetical protein
MVDFTKARMLNVNTPTEDHTAAFGLWVKREDQACKAPGPQFSKTRGVFAHVKARPEEVIGVLDTFHSQAGHAVARACQILGKRCVNFYPEYKHQPGFRPPQERARELGAELVGIPAGRSSVIYHTARRLLAERAPGAYLMPNALKLPESVDETAKEVRHLPEGVEFQTVLLPSSSATIAAGVIKGFSARRTGLGPRFIVHLGYSRSTEAVMDYIAEMTGLDRRTLPSVVTIVDEGYNYKDKSRPGETPPWPCNPYYDLKAFRWWLREGRAQYPGNTLLWNVG